MQQNDIDPAVLAHPLHRRVGGHRMVLAESLRRAARRSHPMRDKKLDNAGGAIDGEKPVARELRRVNGRAVRVAVDLDAIVHRIEKWDEPDQDVLCRLAPRVGACGEQNIRMDGDADATSPIDCRDGAVQMMRADVRLQLREQIGKHLVFVQHRVDLSGLLGPQ